MNRNLKTTALVLVVCGAINWLLVGLFRFDLVATLAGLRFGELNWFNSIVYILVGASGIYLVIAESMERRAERGPGEPTRLEPR